MSPKKIEADVKKLWKEMMTKLGLVKKPTPESQREIVDTFRDKFKKLGFGLKVSPSGTLSAINLAAQEARKEARRKEAELEKIFAKNCAKAMRKSKNGSFEITAKNVGKFFK